MGKYLNIGLDGFASLRNGNYIDKSMLISYINDNLNTPDNLICVSRPRRFGKSSAIKMIAAYFDCTVNSHSLFDDLLISKTQSYSKFINSYNVICLDITWFITISNNINNVVDVLQKEVTDELAKAFPNVKRSFSLPEMIADIAEQTGTKFIILIDEWDALFREAKNNIELQKSYIKMLRGLFKNTHTDKSIAAAYMTGILPIKKYGTESALNNFDEFTMINPAPLSQYIGFTEEEVKSLCEKHSMDFSSMKNWYDGYVFGNLHIYNPKSVLDAIKRQSFSSYWTQTETYESLKHYINMNFDGLKLAVLFMLEGGRCNIITRKFQNDIININSKDDVLTLLVHLGYLAFDNNTDEVYIPNKEIEAEFRNVLEESDWHIVAGTVNSFAQFFSCSIDMAVQVPLPASARHRNGNYSERTTFAY